MSRGCDGRPQDNTSNLLRPRALIEMNSSALSPTLMWPCPERRGVTMGCLYLEIEGQSCLVGSVDQGLMKDRQNDLLDRMTKTRAKINEHFSHFITIATLPGIFQHIAPTRSLETIWPNYRLSIGISLKLCFSPSAGGYKEKKTAFSRVTIRSVKTENVKMRTFDAGK